MLRAAGCSDTSSPTVSRQTPEYLAYLQSDKWALQRAAALARAKYRCMACGGWRDLEVHHLSYERLGAEVPQDLTVLCGHCHKRTHRQESASRLYEARLDGWASKVYGDGWQDSGGEDVAEAFDQWLDGRDE